MDQHVFIVAGSFKQANFLAQEVRLPDTSWTYLRNPNQLLGIRNKFYTFYGTWYTRNDIQKVEEMILRAGLIECKRKTTLKNHLVLATEK
jgi:hypothetical protein